MGATSEFPVGLWLLIHGVVLRELETLSIRYIRFSDSGRKRSCRSTAGSPRRSIIDYTRIFTVADCRVVERFPHAIDFEVNNGRIFNRSESRTDWIVWQFNYRVAFDQVWTYRWVCYHWWDIYLGINNLNQALLSHFLVCTLHSLTYPLRYPVCLIDRLENYSQSNLISRCKLVWCV